MGWQVKQSGATCSRWREAVAQSSAISQRYLLERRLDAGIFLRGGAPGVASPRNPSISRGSRKRSRCGQGQLLHGVVPPSGPSWLRWKPAPGWKIPCCRKQSGKQLRQRSADRSVVAAAECREGHPQHTIMVQLVLLGVSVADNYKDAFKQTGYSRRHMAECLYRSKAGYTYLECTNLLITAKHATSCHFCLLRG